MDKGNLLVWGLVSGLFVASASQCDSKNKNKGGACSQDSASANRYPQWVNWVNNEVHAKGKEPGRVTKVGTVPFKHVPNSDNSHKQKEWYIGDTMDILSDAIQEIRTLTKDSHTKFLDQFKDVDGQVLEEICMIRYKHYVNSKSLYQEGRLSRLNFENRIHKPNDQSLLYAISHTVLYFGRCTLCTRDQYEAAVHKLLQNNAFGALMDEIRLLKRVSFREDVFEACFNAWKNSVRIVSGSRNSAHWAWLPNSSLDKLINALHTVQLTLAYLPLVNSDIDTLHDENMQSLVAFLKRIDNFYRYDIAIQLNWFLTLDFDTLISEIDNLSDVILQNFRAQKS